MNIWLPDGSLEIIRDDQDLIDVVTLYMGAEFGAKVKELVQLSDEAAHKVDSDFRAYEAQVEAQREAFEDINEELTHIHQHLCAKRIDREMVLEIIEQTKVLISNQL